MYINKDDEDWLWEDEEMCEEDYEFQVTFSKLGNISERDQLNQSEHIISLRGVNLTNPGRL